MKSIIFLVVTCGFATTSFASAKTMTIVTTQCVNDLSLAKAQATSENGVEAIDQLLSDLVSFQELARAANQANGPEQQAAEQSGFDALQEIAADYQEVQGVTSKELSDSIGKTCAITE